ncbi:zwei Ig domain protein zig-8-like [Pomacea canaliculata]|uniref:zwei Ig domain protein zig-8-like n=1 Tax=Pomacea canaliculata TaxID=400727 RepID=UPI000D726374|nr:zwei Ig domain protein zig-8-like [Pomacea canaliculata]XP_025077802.1 zwei Ig domain protein zig-8-like [Pomacea canaliculata]XP_025077803.1 zwei Ig domain protein zig-8-like [Pomacea canaliculata]
MLEHDPGSQHWNLLIKRVRLQDAGVYECQVSSKLRHLRHHVLLEVHDTREPISTPTPRPSIQISGSAAVDKDDRIYLICNATGLEYPPEDLDWFFEGIKLATNADEKTFIQKFVSLTDKTIVSILEIRDAQLDHSGIYTCRTSNLLVKSTQVTVLSADTYNVKRGTDKGSKGTPSARLRLSSYASHRLHCLTVVSLLLIVRLSLMLTLSTWSLYG